MNLILDKERNCKETTMFLKECKQIIEYKKAGILNLVYKHGLLFEKLKDPDKFKKIYSSDNVKKM